jgi:hypothetical protein
MTVAPDMRSGLGRTPLVDEDACEVVEREGSERSGNRSGPAFAPLQSHQGPQAAGNEWVRVRTSEEANALRERFHRGRSSWMYSSTDGTVDLACRLTRDCNANPAGERGSGQRGDRARREHTIQKSKGCTCSQNLTAKLKTTCQVLSATRLLATGSRSKRV